MTGTLTLKNLFIFLLEGDLSWLRLNINHGEPRENLSYQISVLNHTENIAADKFYRGPFPPPTEGN